MVHAAGGWDPLFSVDPKADATLNRLTTQVGTAGAIRYADMPIDPTVFGFPADQVATVAPYLPSNADFFQKWGSRLTVINGIDTGTNNHDSGTHGTFSGRADGYPALAALIAGTRAPEKPLAFISAGGYDATFGTVALSRIDDADTVQRIAYPNAMDPSHPTRNTYHTPSTYERIVAAQSERLARLSGQSIMGREQRSQSALMLARADAGALASVQFPTQFAQAPGGVGTGGFFQQAQFALAAFQSGVAVSASLSFGGFDTHSNHDRNQLEQLTRLWGCLDFLFQQVDGLGLTDKVYVVVGSEFGRGPTYNGTGAGAGKDHWPVTSMLAAGPGIGGNRVVGGTDAEQKPLSVDPLSLAFDSQGVRITPALIHRALRKVAGVSGSRFDTEFPLVGNDLPLF